MGGVFAEGDKDTAIGAIKGAMLGGMGSLSDVVLYKDGKLLTAQNDELYDLLNQLYAACGEI